MVVCCILFQAGTGANLEINFICLNYVYAGWLTWNPQEGQAESVLLKDKQIMQVGEESSVARMAFRADNGNLFHFARGRKDDK